MASLRCYYWMQEAACYKYRCCIVVSRTLQDKNEEHEVGEIYGLSHESLLYNKAVPNEYGLDHLQTRSDAVRDAFEDSELCLPNICREK